MKVTKELLDTIISIHITAGIHIDYIEMSVNLLDDFLDNDEIQKSFLINDDMKEFSRGYIGWWSGIELRVSHDIEPDLLYARPLREE